MHSFTSSLHHCVFATKEREIWLTPEIRERLWPYLGGIAREHGMKALAIGGVADEVCHPEAGAARRGISQLAQPLSRTIRRILRITQTCLTVAASATERSLAVCAARDDMHSASVFGIEETCAYIRDQEEHHRTRSYREQVITFFERHGLPFDDAMLDYGSFVPPGLLGWGCRSVTQR